MSGADNYLPNLVPNYGGAQPPPPPTLPPMQYVPGGAVAPGMLATPQMRPQVPTQPPAQASPPQVQQVSPTAAAQPPAVRTPQGPGGDPYAPWPTEQMADYFAQNPATAFAPYQAHGMARYLYEKESGGKPFAFNKEGGGAGAFGSGQWRGIRLRRLVALYGPTPTTQQQADFLLHELVTTEKAALQRIKNATTEQGAYDAMRDAFERPEGPPAGEMQAAANPQYQKMIQEGDENLESSSKALQALQAKMSAADPGSQERHQYWQEAMDHARRMEEHFEQLSEHPPTEKPIDTLQNFGSLATVAAIFGGLLAKRPLTAALNAAGAAMQAKNANNDEQFERAYKLWKDQTSLGVQALSFINQDIRNVMEDERLSEQEKRNQLQDLFTFYNMTEASKAAHLNNFERVFEITSSLAKLESTIKLQTAQMEWYGARARAAGTSGLNQYGDPPDTPSNNPEKPTEGSGIPAGVWAGATQYALTGHMPVLGNSQSGRAQIMSALPWVLAARGMTPADMTEQSISYAGALAGSRTLGTRLANLNVGLSEVPHLGDVLVQVSEETPRSRFMNVNQLLQAAELRTGDPQIVRLGAAMNSYLQAYARAINPTGIITDDIRAHADHILNQALSKGQISAGVNQLNQELRAMQLGLQDAARRGKTMFPLPGEPAPKDPQTAPAPGEVPIPRPKYSAGGGKAFSEDGVHWYGRDGLPYQGSP